MQKAKAEPVPMLEEVNAPKVNQDAQWTLEQGPSSTAHQRGAEERCDSDRRRHNH